MAVASALKEGDCPLGLVHRDFCPDNITSTLGFFESLFALWYSVTVIRENREAERPVNFFLKNVLAVRNFRRSLVFTPNSINRLNPFPFFSRKFSVSPLISKSLL